MPHLKFLVVGALVLGAVTYLMFSGISDSMVYYYTVSETREQAELSTSDKEAVLGDNASHPAFVQCRQLARSQL